MMEARKLALSGLGTLAGLAAMAGAPEGKPDPRRIHEAPAPRPRRSGKQVRGRGRARFKGSKVVKRIVRNREDQNFRALAAADPTRGLTQYQCDTYTRDRLRKKLRPIEHYRTLVRARA